MCDCNKKIKGLKWENRPLAVIRADAKIDDGPGFVASCDDIEITLKGDAVQRFLECIGEKNV